MRTVVRLLLSAFRPSIYSEDRNMFEGYLSSYCLTLTSKRGSDKTLVHKLELI